MKKISKFLFILTALLFISIIDVEAAGGTIACKYDLSFPDYGMARCAGMTIADFKKRCDKDSTTPEKCKTMVDEYVNNGWKDESTNSNSPFYCSDMIPLATPMTSIYITVDAFVSLEHCNNCKQYYISNVTFNGDNSTYIETTNLNGQKQKMEVYTANNHGVIKDFRYYNEFKNAYLYFNIQDSFYTRVDMNSTGEITCPEIYMYIENQNASNVQDVISVSEPKIVVAGAKAANWWNYETKKSRYPAWTTIYSSGSYYQDGKGNWKDGSNLEGEEFKTNFECDRFNLIGVNELEGKDINLYFKIVKKQLKDNYNVTDWDITLADKTFTNIFSSTHDSDPDEEFYYIEKEVAGLGSKFNIILNEDATKGRDSFGNAINHLDFCTDDKDFWIIPIDRGDGKTYYEITHDEDYVNRLKNKNDQGSYDEGNKVSGCEVIPEEIRKWIVNILKFIRYVALVLVVALGALDFMKAAGSGEADAMKKAGQTFMKRLIAVAVLFLLPVLVDFILNMVNLYGVDSNNVDCLQTPTNP